ncbi:MAG: hypothetical protein H8E16_15730 [Flavobacteriales bacterium]|nr:hypothetical protein [Flavobacteriales bacterium]
MSKIITDELIEKKLKEKGLSMYDQVESSLEKLQNYYEFELTDSYNKTPDYSIFAETTADGYEVWVATSGDGRNICINEDVYYYENDLSDALYNAMFDYNELIYVDDLEAYYVQDAIDRAWESFIDDMIGEVEDELIEQGYEREEQAEVA